MRTPDTATVQALRVDVALQIARHAQQLGLTQVAVAKQLGIPQPTLSKIINGRVSDLSLELLIRTAVRGGLFLTLQTGRSPQEAGAFASMLHATASRTFTSKLVNQARESLKTSELGLSPSQRLEAFLEHNQHAAQLREAGRAAELERARSVARLR